MRSFGHINPGALEEKAILKKQNTNHSNEFIQEVKESLDDYKRVNM